MPACFDAGKVKVSIFLIYSPDSTNVYGANDGEIERIWSRVGVGVGSCKIVFLGGTSYSLVHTLLL